MGYPDAKRSIRMPERRIWMLSIGIRMRSFSKPRNEQNRYATGNQIISNLYYTIRKTWENQVPIDKNQYYEWENGLKLEKSKIQINWKTYSWPLPCIYIYTYSEIGSLIKRKRNLGFDIDKWSRKNWIAIQALKKHDQTDTQSMQILDFISVLTAHTYIHIYITGEK